MAQDEIIEMARNVGFSETDGLFRTLYISSPSDIQAFAKLVATKEREACAKVCEDIFNAPEPIGCGGDEYYYTKPFLICADAIRARGGEA